MIRPLAIPLLLAAPAGAATIHPIVECRHLVPSAAYQSMVPGQITPNVVLKDCAWPGPPDDLPPLDVASLTGDDLLSLKTFGNEYPFPVSPAPDHAAAFFLDTHAGDTHAGGPACARAFAGKRMDASGRAVRTLEDEAVRSYEFHRKDCAGVYCLWRGSECMYVGQTENIFNRIGSHWGKDFDRVTWQPEPNRAKRLNLEEEQIKSLHPEWNVKHAKDGGLRDERLRTHGLRGQKILCGADQ